MAGNYTGEEMKAIAWKVAEDLKTNPIDLGNGTAFDYAVMRGLFALALYGPDNWPLLMGMLPYLASNQTSDPKFIKMASGFLKGFLGTVGPIPALYGIHCGDRIPRLDSLEEYRPVQERLNKISKVMDGSSTALSMACGLWKSDAVERYTGDFHVKTKNPVLVSNNRYDGHTPLKSAYNISATFEGSSVLVVNGFGVRFLFLRF